MYPELTDFGTMLAYLEDFLQMVLMTIGNTKVLHQSLVLELFHLAPCVEIQVCYRPMKLKQIHIIQMGIMQKLHELFPDTMLSLCSVADSSGNEQICSVYSTLLNATPQVCITAIC
jgi:hypothetical protein